MTKITRASIIKMATKQEYIPLIKTYRKITGYGLKQAKDAIDNLITVIPSINNQETGRVFDAQGLLNLFEPYIQLDINIFKIQLNQGINCMLDNYSILGFDNPFVAIRVVLDNLENKNKTD